MARRQLEAAIQAGQAIEKGKSIPSKFKSVTEIGRYDCGHDEGVYSLQYSYDGEHLAVGSGHGQIVLLNSRTGKLEQELRKGRYGGYQIMCLRFNPKNPDILLAGSSDGRLYSFNLKTGNSKEELHEKGNEINALDFCLDGYNFATGGKDLSVRIYDTSKMKEVHTYTGYSPAKPPTELSIGVTQRVFALKYHPRTEYMFLTGGWENQIKIWDARSQDGIKRAISGPHICGDSLDIRNFDILTGSWSGIKELQTWSYTEGTHVKNIKFPSENGAFLYCAQYCDNDVVLAGGSGTNSVKAINEKTDECLGEIKMDKVVQAMDCTYGGRLFAVGGGDKYIKLASMS